MTQRTVKHEVKLQTSVVVILGVLAFGVCAKALIPTFSVKKADAALIGRDDGMIIGTGDQYIWQLKDGQVRRCVEPDYKTPIRCTQWKN